MTSALLPTKNDSYAILIAEGRNRGFDVIPEFRVRLPCVRRNKSIDLVWALRAADVGPFQDRRTQDYWDIVATFEIEACDVRVNKEFRRHLEELPTLKNAVSNRSICHCVVLYSAAFDRSSIAHRNSVADIITRQKHAAPLGVKVFSVDDKQSIENLPK